MSSGNRVEMLETRVTELEATVQGLTEELVQANERIRHIETALGGSADSTEADDDGEVLESHGWGPGSAGSVDDDPEADADSGTEAVSRADDDAEAVSRAAEADKSGETDGGDEGELDDIIVA